MKKVAPYGKKRAVWSRKKPNKSELWTDGEDEHLGMICCGGDLESAAGGYSAAQP